TRLEWRAARGTLLKQLETSEATLANDRADAVVGDFVGRSELLRSTWDDLADMHKRTITEALVEQIIVLPAVAPTSPSQDRVVVWWRADPRPSIRPWRRRGMTERRAAGVFANCSVTGCGRAYLAKGYCSMHYQRWHTSGDPGDRAPRKQLPHGDPPCEIKGCSARAFAAGLCNPHHHLARLGKVNADA